MILARVFDKAVKRVQLESSINEMVERSAAVVECLTRDRESAARQIYPSLILVQSRKTVPV